MNKFSGIFGIFDRASRLRDDALLADIYEGLDNLQCGDLGKCHRGPERDFANFRKDKENLSRDIGRAFLAARQKLGA